MVAKPRERHEKKTSQGQTPGDYNRLRGRALRLQVIGHKTKGQLVYRSTLRTFSTNENVREALDNEYH